MLLKAWRRELLLLYDCGVWEHFVGDHMEAALGEPRTLGFSALKLGLVCCNTPSFTNPF